MKAAWLLLGLCLAATAWGEDSSGVLHIRAGRAALAASNPALARAEFQAAVNSSLTDGDGFAAWLGLGRAELWLGDYRAASCFRPANPPKGIPLSPIPRTPSPMFLTKK